MSIDPKNNYLASCALDQLVRVWDLRTGAPVLTIAVDSPVLTIEFHPLSFEDGRNGILMATCTDGFLRLWNVDIRRKTFSDSPMKYYCKTLTRDTIRLASFSPSGTRIVVGATDGIIRLLRTPAKDTIVRGDTFPTLQPYIYYLEDHEGYVNCIHFSMDGTEFITGSWDGTVRLWSFDEGSFSWKSECYSSYDHFPSDNIGRGRKVTMISFARNDEIILTAVNELFVVLVFEKSTGELLHTLKYHTKDIQVVVPHPSILDLVMTASYDGSVALWNISTGQILFSTRSHSRFDLTCFSLSE